MTEKKQFFVLQFPSPWKKNQPTNLKQVNKKLDMDFSISVPYS